MSLLYPPRVHLHMRSIRQDYNLTRHITFSDLESNTTYVNAMNAAAPPPEPLHTAVCLAIVGTCVTLFTTSLASKPSSTSTARNLWAIAVIAFFLATFFSCIILVVPGDLPLSNTRWRLSIWRALIMIMLGTLAFAGAAFMAIAVILDGLKGGNWSSVPPSAAP